MFFENQVMLLYCFMKRFESQNFNYLFLTHLKNYLYNKLIWLSNFTKNGSIFIHKPLVQA